MGRFSWVILQALSLATFVFILLVIDMDVKGASASGSWDPQFRLPPGLNDEVYTMVSNGKDLYVGGWFTKAGEIKTQGLAKWDGTNWSTVGGGVNGYVTALAVDGTNLFVGGSFQMAGEVPVNNIAKWSGEQWEALGSGVEQSFMGSPCVWAIFPNGKDLYVGGNFLLAGGNTAFNVAKWDGSSWISMNKGAYLDDLHPWGMVFSITGDKRYIYVGGIFDKAGDKPATHLARWNGEVWESFGDISGGQYYTKSNGEDLYGYIDSMVMHQGDLYVGGEFSSVGTVIASNLAKWNGARWSAPGETDGAVNALESISGNLYVVGRFNHLGESTITNLAILSSGSWHALNAETHGSEQINAIAHFSGQLYLAGTFNEINSVITGKITRWNGTNWLALGSRTGNCLTGPVKTLATDGTNVFAVGKFSNAGTIPVSDFARWDGSNWLSIGTPFLGQADQVVVQGTNIFVGGSFVMPEVGATNLACWNGSAWTSIVSPMLGISNVDAMVVAFGKLFIYGSIIDSQRNMVRSLCEWDGAKWTTPPIDLSSLYFQALASDGKYLYIAGIRGGTMDVQVVRWNGYIKEDVGELIPEIYFVQAFSAWGTNVYLSGVYPENNIPVILSWSGTSWLPIELPSISSGNIFTIFPVGDSLYIGGNFKMGGEIQANSIAKRVGTNWYRLGQGIEYRNGPGWVNSILVSKRKVFVGGEFTAAGGIDSGNFAVWNETPEIRIQNVTTHSNDSFAFEVSGNPGDQIDIEASSRLYNWEPIGSIELTNNFGVFNEPHRDSAQRFYRAKLKP